MYGQRPFLSLQVFKFAVAAGVLMLLFALTSEMRISLSKTSQQEVTSQQEIETAPPGQEKKLGLVVPAHLPLKVKVKNLNSKKWVHDLEVEVTNTSDKPIYFLDFSLILQDVTGSSNNHKIAFRLRYGRGQLVDLSVPVTSEDIPLEPGEKYTFSISEAEAKGWDYLREKGGKPEPKRISLVFQVLNFGDGTGYVDSGGTPTDVKKKINKNCLGPPNPLNDTFLRT